MKRNNYDDKIANIYSERIEMLKIIKDGLSKNQNNINSNIDDIQLILMYDKNSIEGYKSVLKAKKMINELLEKISACNNIEDVIKLRKKINYYITIINRIIKERDIEDDVLNSLKNSTLYLRKNMAKYVSFLKRENKLNEINKLNNSFQNLSKEEKNQLRNYLKNESKYNKRILSSNVVKNNNIIPTNNTSIDKYNPYKELLEDEDCVEIKENNNTINFQRQNQNTPTIDELEYNVCKYDRVYKLKDIYPYDNNKLINFFKNIPIYYRNKKIIRKMIVDYNCFTLDEDLLGYIFYSQKRNSIMLAIEQIFNKSKLSENEIKCLYNHSQCKEWINNYFYSNIENDARLVKTI